MHGIDDKKHALNEYCKHNDIDMRYVAFLGNDINDKEAMELVGYSLCPSDAHSSIKLISDYVFDAGGGEGVVRELLDKINEQKGE